MAVDFNYSFFGKPSYLAWLPDETLYSLVSRHHHFWGHVLSSHTCEQFFGHPRAGSQHDLPSRLADFVTRTEVHFGTAENIAKQRTLLAYYAAFIPAVETQNAIVAMAGNSVVHLKLRLGILTSRFRANHPLKACEACIDKDRATRGWAYWHLAHQYPGVWMCLEHHQLLRESILKSTGVERFQWLLPAADSFREWPADLHSALRAVRIPLTSFSSMVTDIVSRASIESIDMSRLHEVYRAEIARRGWTTPGGNVRMSMIARSYLEHVKPLQLLPEMEALPTTEEDATIQLGRMLRPPRGSTHPLRHLVLAHWLFGSTDTFWSAYEAMRAQPVPNIYPTQVQACAANAEDPRHTQLLSLLGTQKMSYRAAAKLIGIDVGTAMAWAGQAGMAISRRPKKLTERVRSKAIRQLKNGAEKAIVAKAADVSIVTITKLLLSEPGLHAAWCESRNEKARSQARTTWIQLLSEHPAVGIKFIRSVDPAAYAWLYRNDRAWLEEHKPPPQPTLVDASAPRVLWDVRDELLSVEVRRAVLEIQNRIGTRSIKLWQIYQAVPALKPKLAVLSRLPLTQRAIEQVLQRRTGGADPDLFT